MKKSIVALVLLCVVCCSSLFAKKSEPIYSKGDNVFTFEVTGAGIGFSANQVITYDRMLSEKFGIGGGIAASEGLVSTIDGFVDLKFNKWSLGLGGGYNYISKSPSFIFRGVYHGNSWNWGQAKAGWTLGIDWHLSASGIDTGDGLGNFMFQMIGILPRVVIGLNCQLK